MIDALEVGYAIKKRRVQLGMTQAQLAQAAGISKRCLWSLELGQNSGVQLNKLTAVFDALGLDLKITSASNKSYNASSAKKASTSKNTKSNNIRTSKNTTNTAQNSPKKAAAKKNKKVDFDALAILTERAK